MPARDWTLLVQGVNLHDDDADRLLRRFAFIPYARLDDLMASYAAPGGGVGPHYDSYDVFLLQGYGRRRWRYGRQQHLALRPGAPVNVLARFLLVGSRSVNSLVWALLFVGIFGPGPLAGMLAIAFRSIGFVGKLFGEALEEAAPGPVEALRAAGAPWLSVLGYGYWPQVKPAFWSVALFRFDINVRESAVLGLVGAGGIGMALDAALNLFQWDRVALILVAILAVVIVTEIAVTFVRQRVL